MVIAWGKNDMGQSNAPDNLYMMQMDVGADFGAGIYTLAPTWTTTVRLTLTIGPGLFRGG